MNWFDKYGSSFHLTEAERDFLSKYTEEEFQALLPENFILRASKKMTVVDCVKSVIHYYTWGKWVYFGENEYLNNIGGVKSKFETWMRKEFPHCSLDKAGGYYLSSLTVSFWRVWYAATKEVIG